MAKTVNLGRKKTIARELSDAGEISDKQISFLSAFVKARGVVADACKRASVARDTYYRWMKENPAFNALITRAEEEPLDYVKGKLFQKIDQGNITAILAYLRAHDERFGEKVTVNGKLGLSASWYDEIQGKSEPKQLPIVDRGAIGELHPKQSEQLTKAIEAGNGELVREIVQKVEQKVAEKIEDAEVHPE